MLRARGRCAAIDGDALRVLLGVRRFRQGHRQHAIVERSIGLFDFNLEGQRDHAFEAAVCGLGMVVKSDSALLPLGVLPRPTLHFTRASGGQEELLDVQLVFTWKFGGHNSHAPSIVTTFCYSIIHHFIVVARTLGYILATRKCSGEMFIRP